MGIGSCLGRVQLNQSLSLCYALTIVHMNLADNASDRWLNDFHTRTWNQLSLCGRNDVKSSEHRK
ncbi:hypothetical protein WM08_27710 [Burkholderia ubonensis]|nr:hypothetical protein WI84_14340 [Burkholderia ubonensis]KVD78486.1 hypothetical protein WI89_30635 [Burkholderia ubonensis]KVP89888.1 hypothetical protein WJ97_23110 [Burkholderia ubonensis]KVQ08342.1 hypothetical protein WJ99_23240 [Burkholderia ubonensis]KVU59942.1 hypothetical protein WK71_30565 [Burkholderia ubonensis]